MCNSVDGTAVKILASVIHSGYGNNNKTVLGVNFWGHW